MACAVWRGFPRGLSTMLSTVKCPVECRAALEAVSRVVKCVGPRQRDTLESLDASRAGHREVFELICDLVL